MLVEAMWMVANVAGDCTARGKGGGDVRAGLRWLRGRAIAMKLKWVATLELSRGRISQETKKETKIEINRSF